MLEIEFAGLTEHERDPASETFVVVRWNDDDIACRCERACGLIREHRDDGRRSDNIEIAVIESASVRVDYMLQLASVPEWLVTRTASKARRRSSGVTSTMHGDSCLSALACSDATVIVRSRPRSVGTSLRAVARYRVARRPQTRWLGHQEPQHLLARARPHGSSASVPNK